MGVYMLPLGVYSLPFRGISAVGACFMDCKHPRGVCAGAQRRVELPFARRRGGAELERALKTGAATLDASEVSAIHEAARRRR